MANETLRIWCIGPDMTEYFVAHSVEELREYYIKLCGKKQAEEDMEAHFEEMPQSAMDEEFEFDDDGKTVKTTWREQADRAIVPCQISTGYN